MKTITTKIFVTAFIALAIALIFTNLCFAQDSQDQNKQNTQDQLQNKSVKFFLTSDIHSYFEETKDINEDGEIVEHGNSAKLATILKQRKDNNSLFLDGGDFSMGTLLHTEYTTNAFELRLLGQLGCDVTTIGNHEFDFGPQGLADMLHAAKKNSSQFQEQLPEIVLSNIEFYDNNSNSSTNPNDPNTLKDAFKDYGIKPYTIKEVNGVKVGIFGLEGIDSIDCAPTNGQQWINYVESARNTVAELKDKADLIVCLSHGGTNQDGSSGEDTELLKQIPEINLCLSAHSHYPFKPVKINDSYLVGPGCYLQYLDQLNMTQNSEGKWELNNFEQIPIRGNIAEDPQIKSTLQEFNKETQENYLSQYAGGDGIDDVICYSPYTYPQITTVLKSEEEYPMKDIIADSYMYAAKKNGINDVDFSVVGIGTLRTSFTEGPITTEDAFRVCSLGVDTDNSAGHPLCACYVKGKDLRLFVELETSMGKLKDGVNMSYHGLQVTWNSQRMIMDKVTDIKLKHEDGSLESIDDNKTYKFLCNLYALNMLGSVNSLAKGLIKITPLDANGNELTDYASMAIKDKNGKNIKEWVAFKDYLKSLKTIPEKYSGPQERKVNTNKGGIAVITNPGPSTIVAIIVILVFAIIVFFIVRKLVRNLRKD